MRNLAVLLIIGLTVYCIIDVVRSTNDERLGVHPALWVLLILVVPLLGSAAWLAVRWSRRTAAGGPGPSQRPRRATGPDDDPDFLSGLDEDRRRTDRGGPDDAGPTA
ncbi:PLDc N-terminal domain-containing protein [uncultured Cellulomonas sp.]|uniref:PLDc N-terminal domain-containing protein n=1 Tax=uncultured Cellulomonas sp. TaxID=189682 RepID=UPI0028E90359|nr:PLDc N-terminal domain-containing protein [uncultured Cellulomonas sp.]